MKDIKPIETVYRGYRFRSRLEARWAVFFDAMGIEWRYEEQGFELEDGSRYLPDFYLPESNTFFEVKGQWTDSSRSKVDLLLKAGCRVAVGYEVGVFQGTNSNMFPDESLGTEVETYSLAHIDDSYFAQCRECNKHWFAGGIGIYACPCCGAWDGDHHLAMMLPVSYANRNEGIKEAIIAAKQARFEHGESPEVKHAPPTVH